MKKTFTLLFSFAFLMLSVAQTATDKNGNQLKPVYRITHEGVSMFYEVVHADSNSTSNSGNNTSSSTTNNSAAASSGNSSTTGTSYYTVESLKASMAKTAEPNTPLQDAGKPLDVVDVSPNPFKDDLSINIHKGFEGVVNVSVLDLLGNTAYSQEFNIEKDDDLIGIDLSNAEMKPGIYILRIEVGGTMHMMRVVKR